MVGKPLPSRRAWMIALAVALGALCVVPSTTAVAQPTHSGKSVHRSANPGGSHGPHGNHGKPHQSHGKPHGNSHGNAHQSHGNPNGKPHGKPHGKAHQSHGNRHSGKGPAVHAATASTPKPGLHGRHPGHAAKSHPKPKTGNHGHHLGKGHQTNHGHPAATNAATGHASNRTPRHITSQRHGRRSVSQHSRPHVQRQQTAPRFANVVRATRQPRPIEPGQRHHATPEPGSRTHKSGTHKTRTQAPAQTPRQQPPRSIGTQLIQQFTRPGSPAMVLSLIVLMCLIGTVVVVSMARRRPSKPHS